MSSKTTHGCLLLLLSSLGFIEAQLISVQKDDVTLSITSGTDGLALSLHYGTCLLVLINAINSVILIQVKLKSSVP